MKFSGRIFSLILILLILLTCSGCGLIPKLLYPVPRTAVGSPPPSPLSEVIIPVQPSVKIVGWLSRTEPENDSTPVLLFFHRSAENLQTLLQQRFFGKIARSRMHCLVIDYPGYGNSSGTPNETIITQAADSAFIWIKRNFKDNPRFVGGNSLGAAVAIQIAERHSSDLRGLIVINGWTSLPVVNSKRFPKWLVRFLPKEQYNSRVAIQSAELPTVMMHSEFNRRVPLLQGKELSENAPQLKKWVVIKGVAHDDVMDNERVWEEMTNFMKNPDIE